MGTEIERKFLVRNDAWRAAADDGTRYCQGYLSDGGGASVRVRVAGAQANINIKSAVLGMVRREYEYPIALADAREMLEHLCQRPFIEKVRHKLVHGPHTWEIDVFEGDNQGLVVAEIELQDPAESFERLTWVGEEVTHEQRYYNVSLVKHPFKDW